MNEEVIYEKCPFCLGSGRIPLTKGKVSPPGPPLPTKNEIIHMCPPEGSALTPCCAKTPFELPPDSQLTTDETKVTCPGPGPVTCHDQEEGA